MDTETGRAVPRSAVAVTVTLRGHTLIQDKPQSSGGLDLGPMSSELLLAAVLGCQHSTFVKVAAKRRLDARITALEGAMDFKDGDITAIRVIVTITGPGDDGGITTALRLSERSCTISRALKVPVEVTFRRA